MISADVIGGVDGADTAAADADEVADVDEGATEESATEDATSLATDACVVALTGLVFARSSDCVCSDNGDVSELFCFSDSPSVAG